MAGIVDTGPIVALLNNVSPSVRLGVLKLFSRGLIEVRFSLIAECSAVVKLATRYANVWMSVADACLVRMAEIHAGLPRGQS